MKFDSLQSFSKARDHSFRNLDVSKDTHDIRQHLEKAYREYKEPNQVIEGLIPLLGTFFEHIDRNIFPQEKMDEILSSLEGCRRISGKKEFLDKVMQALQPFIFTRATYPKEFEAALSKASNKKQGYIELNRLVTYEKKDNIIVLHHSIAKTIGPKLRLYYDAMKQLAKIIEADPGIQQVEAASWIVREAPDLFAKNEFEIKDLDEKDNEGRPISVAFISREKFLGRFGSDLKPE